MIRRYDCILTVIDQSKDKMLALKFNIIDGRLYVFNYYDLPENNQTEQNKISRFVVNYSGIQKKLIPQIIAHMEESLT